MLKQKIRKFIKEENAVYCLVMRGSSFTSALGLFLSSGIPKVQPVESYDGDNSYITLMTKPDCRP